MFRVVQVSCDGAWIDPEGYPSLIDACETAMSMVSRAQAWPDSILCYVKVMDDRCLNWRQVARYGVRIAR